MSDTTGSKIKATAAIALVVVAATLVWLTRPRTSNPFAQARPMHATLRGHVVERADAGSYLYLRVVDEHGVASWVATLRFGAPTTGDVTATLLARADRFTSPRLHHTFSPLYFGTVHGAPSPVPNIKESQ